MFAVVIVGIGGGIQQASFYGLAGLFPPKYTQALMLGESMAGVVVSVNRITTKSAFGDTLDDVRRSTFIFFYLTMSLVLICQVEYR